MLAPAPDMDGAGFQESQARPVPGVAGGAAPVGNGRRRLRQVIFLRWDSIRLWLMRFTDPCTQGTPSPSTTAKPSS